MDTRILVLWLVVVVLAALLFLNRFEFFHLEGSVVIRCSNIFGQCELIRASVD